MCCVDGHVICFFVVGGGVVVACFFRVCLTVFCVYCFICSVLCSLFVCVFDYFLPC